MEYPLNGGNVTSVVRVEDTVRRVPSRWTPGVHAVLRLLEAKGYPYSPRPRGFDEQGREILTWIEGVGGFFDQHCVIPDNLWSDQVLVEVAQALRVFHDATAGIEVPASIAWQVIFPDSRRHEVICHNDLGPYNCVFRDGHLTGIIDFDTMGPGPRLWDVVYGAYRFVPLTTAEQLARMGIEPGIQIGKRLRLWCDAYGLEERAEFVDMLVMRLEATAAMLVDGARDGNAGYQRILAEGGHLEGLYRDAAFIEENRVTIEAWLSSQDR